MKSTSNIIIKRKERKKMEINKKQEKRNKKGQNPETLAAVHTHTHRCFKE